MTRVALTTQPSLVTALLLFTGCATTSISNTGNNPLYQGEIHPAPAS